LGGGFGRGEGGGGRGGGSGRGRSTAHRRPPYHALTCRLPACFTALPATALLAIALPITALLATALPAAGMLQRPAGDLPCR